MSRFSDEVSGAGSMEAATIRAAQADRRAFAPLYLQHRDRVYASLRTRTTSLEDAADLTQHVFLQALDALPRYRPRGAPFAA
jgi:RNA polymerase sigma-70 factor (ECF subfamily)